MKIYNDREFPGILRYRDQFFPIPVPVLFSGTIFSGTGTIKKGAKFPGPGNPGTGMSHSDMCNAGNIRCAKLHNVAKCCTITERCVANACVLPPPWQSSRPLPRGRVELLLVGAFFKLQHWSFFQTSGRRKKLFCKRIELFQQEN